MALSLDELLQVQTIMPGAITKGESKASPASLTSISAEQIEKTPARNILDLIEIYVPGATWLNYEEGPLLGMRGNIVNGNYKYLLTLNGRILNSKAMRGAQSELEQWNLSDIKKIDIIRSPVCHLWTRCCFWSHTYSDKASSRFRWSTPTSELLK